MYALCISGALAVLWRLYLGWNAGPLGKTICNYVLTHEAAFWGYVIIVVVLLVFFLYIQHFRPALCRYLLFSLLILHDIAGSWL